MAKNKNNSVVVIGWFGEGGIKFWEERKNI
jgi:hypothetical protein